MWVSPIPLMEDELLSSWLVRSALMMGCDPLLLTNTIWPSWRAWTLDLDRTLSSERLVQLQKYTGLNCEVVDGALLRPIAERIWTSGIPPTAVWPWILSTGSRNRKRRTGPQFCPVCFASAKRPYLSRAMRLAWHTCCEIHGLRLLDECQICHSPLEPHRLKIEDDRITTCASCHSELSKQTSSPLSASALKFQNEADCTLLNGAGQFLGCQVSAPEWFQLVDYFVSLMRRSSHAHFERLSAILKQLGVRNSWHVGNTLGIEQLSTNDRILLLENVWAISRHSLGDLQLLLNQYNCSQEMVSLWHGAKVPEVLTPVIHSLPSKKSGKNKSSKRLVRSRSVVEKMMARLVRKLRMRER